MIKAGKILLFGIISFGLFTACSNSKESNTINNTNDNLNSDLVVNTSNSDESNFIDDNSAKKEFKEEALGVFSYVNKRALLLVKLLNK